MIISKVKCAYISKPVIKADLGDFHPNMILGELIIVGDIVEAVVENLEGLSVSLGLHS